MIEGGSNFERQRQAVRQFLQEFDGDLEAAIHAVKEYKTLGGFASPEVEQVGEPTVIPTGPVLLSAHNLVKEYKLGKQRLKVLNDVSLTIHEGEFIAITGASGSGKSTLLQLLGGLDKPTSGDVLIGDVSIAKLSDGKLSAFRRQTVGFVFQFFYLQPFLRLKQNLEVPGMFARTKRKDRAQRVQDLANKVGLGDRLKHFPRELSGGQMQRAAIARALLNNPKILLADEPTGNLDSQNGTQIIDLFESIRRELGMTVVIVTHDTSIARRADRVIHIVDGRVA